jgi:hypothetical protein
MEGRVFRIKKVIKRAQQVRKLSQEQKIQENRKKLV